MTMTRDDAIDMITLRGTKGLAYIGNEGEYIQMPGQVKMVEHIFCDELYITIGKSFWATVKAMPSYRDHKDQGGPTIHIGSFLIRLK